MGEEKYTTEYTVYYRSWRKPITTKYYIDSYTRNKPDIVCTDGCGYGPTYLLAISMRVNKKKVWLEFNTPYRNDMALSQHRKYTRGQIKAIKQF